MGSQLWMVVHIYWVRRPAISCINISSPRPSWWRIYVYINWVTVSSDDGSSPARHQAIIWINHGLLSIGPLPTKLNDNLNQNSHWTLFERFGAKWRPLRLLSNMKNTLRVAQNVASQIQTNLLEKKNRRERCYSLRPRYAYMRLQTRCQAIIWTNTGVLLIGPLGTNFNEILIKSHTF